MNETVTLASRNCASSELQARCYHVTGIVQGVGFRPWIYQLAQRYGLCGHVLNNGEGVTIVVQAELSALQAFNQALQTEMPPLARIDSLHYEALAVDMALNDFSIHKSTASTQALVAVGTDKSSCPECLQEIRDPNNRHYHYPFTNCTHCGPRYTIINNLPYDRHNTSMAAFAMCDDCRRAYEDPMDRRYHAQPVSCPKCGPQLRFVDNHGQQLATREAAFAAAVAAIQAGKILAIKGLGGFHLVCDATNHQAVTELRLRKHRPAKPLAVMVADLPMAQQYAVASAAEWQLLCSQERPIVLLQKAAESVLPLSAAVAPDIDRIGLFMPYTPLHTLLLDAVKKPLVATSANLSGEPIITDGDAILAQLANEHVMVIDAMLDHNRPILNGCDDSVVQMCGGELQVLRLARGYAPLSLPSKQLAKHPLPAVLAVGPQQKNTLALNIGNTLYLSPHIGDLFSIGAEGYFQRTLASFKRMYHFDAELIVRDLHPDYASSRWALEQTPPVTAVQHHYAHVLATLAANDYNGQVLGFSFDGTGLGADGELWGGELLLADSKSYQRLASISPFALLGNELAIKSPFRLTLALLLQQYSIDAIIAMELPAFRHYSPVLLRNLAKIFAAGKMPKSHSVGRLFDALAVLLDEMQDTQYEGQAGIIIETLARRAVAAGKNADAQALNLQLPLRPQPGLLLGQWDTAALFSQLLQAKQQQDNGVMAIAFMQALGDAVCHSAVAAQQQIGSPLPVVLTGGVFQNRFLAEYCYQQLHTCGMQRLPQHLVPVNDGGIALGQLWYGLQQATATA
ncbi:carbamoyltransferase HypF [Shewanella dokdonensis]|uniref:carbamoyltransferase HypF n=2 Tax=Shewanella dokdonensis TaxID=712036 RepID=UPI002010520E|nr:carbamoyltransferase HypF [Shewanella dokdonensis]MCL1073132.1 carbamoyltransferase HypF [Shewanella dokdonensis]